MTIAGATAAIGRRDDREQADQALAPVVGLLVHRADRAVEIARAHRVPVALPEGADADLTAVQIEDPIAGRTSGAKHRSCNRCLKCR